MLKRKRSLLLVALILLSFLPMKGIAQQQPAVAAQDETIPIDIKTDNADIHQIIRIICDALGLNYIVDPAVKGVVNLYTNTQLKRSDLLPILESILKINNATMIKTGNFYQIVPAASAAKQPLPVIDQSTQTVPDDQVVIQVIRMKFVAAAEIAKVLTPYLSDGGNITVHDTGNIILLTDRRSNVRKLLEIIDEFDTAAFRGERIRLLPVKNNHARDVVDDLRTIFSGYGLSDKASAIRFIVIDRLNSVLVVTPNADVFPEIEKWLTTLDQPTTTAGVRNFVYKAKNAKASDLQKVLADLYGQNAQGIPNQAGLAGGQNPAASPQQTQVAQPLQPGRAATTGLNTGIRIIADELNNALVIQATPQEYAEIQRVIDELDVLRRQVLIDAQVYEVVLDNSLSFGISAQLQNRDLTKNSQSLGTANAPAGITANTFTYVGRTRELVSFLNATENRSKVKTLSSPSVLVTDNGTANFQVGTDVPVPTTSSASGVQGAGGATLFAQQIQFRTTGVLLTVKPQINISGNVTMDLSQEISQAGANTTSTIAAPVIGKSSVTSQIVVEDGQTIAIGGFIRENNELAGNRIPIVGRVPGLGVLFGSTTRSSTRTELIVLITPHVLRTHQEADAATDELKAKLKEIKRLIQ